MHKVAAAAQLHNARKSFNSRFRVCLFQSLFFLLSEHISTRLSFPLWLETSLSGKQSF
jgi:hypothetical protein